MLFSKYFLKQDREMLVKKRTFYTRKDIEE